MQTSNEVGIRFARRGEHLQAEHRRHLNGHLVLCEKQKIDLDAKSRGGFGLLHSVEGERPNVTLVREALVEKLHVWLSSI